MKELKKLLYIFLALVLILTLTKCGKKQIEDETEQAITEPSEDVEISLSEPAPPIEKEGELFTDDDMSDAREESSSQESVSPPESKTSTPPAASSGAAKTDQELKGEIRLTVTPEKLNFDYSKPVAINIEVENIGTGRALFVLGSGSNTIPDSMKFTTTPEIIQLNHSAIMTDDYGVQTLESGEKKSYTAKFAPYIGEGFVDKDTPISDILENPSFSKMPSGELTIKVSLTYTDIAGADNDNVDVFSLSDNLPEQKAESSITVNVK